MLTISNTDGARPQRATPRKRRIAREGFEESTKIDSRFRDRQCQNPKPGTKALSNPARLAVL
jgi:hypothetical protein